MKAVIVGAGAIGGFIAARMLEAGLDVTLLVREGRKRKLEETGLVVRSPAGDYRGHPPLLTSGQPGGPFDLAIIASKSYGLPEVLIQLRPYLHSRTFILPFLNGMKHMEQIMDAYPGQPLLGGVARIEATLGEDGAIHHMTPHHLFTYGRFRNFADHEYENARAVLSSVPLFAEKSDIERDLWEKYAFINVLSGLTTLFQAPVGDIREAPRGMDTFKRAFTETVNVIRKAGGTLSDDFIDKQLLTVSKMSARSTSSMLRDLTQGLPTEADHIQGYLVELAQRHDCEIPLIEVIYQRLAIYAKSRSTASS
ncbi:ketopantoate reductase family protein [Cohnella cholangitidis]|uniref:2-dehydropantoate 2-reductase n=1 Tax=Cohnella cholangitidis TaxID=2598458 RepID=A0A7G5BXW9_9BACL|nr:ketopantoate reductase family protein [Cohnella cholangitidis]QMV41803.1 ketopantoate reductase family protein [Cohnella cholangitidis]